jgi:AcrR family transcriptional regulator
LNVRSTKVQQVVNEETEARIRDAAVVLFAEQGYGPTTVRQVAERAEVSAGLVIHYFGSKDGLRASCDRHVAELIRSGEEDAAAQGTSLDLLGSLKEAAEGPPLLRYLARALAERSPGLNDLFDQMVADAAAYSRTMVDTGVIRPSAFHDERAVVLVTWSLGALVLHEHLERALGFDMLSYPENPASGLAYYAPVLEMLSEGIFTPEAAEHYLTAVRDLAAAGAAPDPDGSADPPTSSADTGRDTSGGTSSS